MPDIGHKMHINKMDYHGEIQRKKEDNEDPRCCTWL